LASIDLELDRGEFVSVLGPSGCGKTTLLNIISGLFKPEAGKLYLNGEEVANGQGQVAYMQQKDLLLPWRTALDNAALGLELQGTSKEVSRQEARELFERFGLRGFERRYPQELSGGMRQRVALIRTLLTKKELLLLDEPFGSLDAMTRSVLHSSLLQLWQDFKKTILFVTHDLEEAILLSDRIYVFTARPAQVKAIIEVPLPRPRQSTAMDFIKFKSQLLELVQEEIHEIFSS